MCFRYAVVVAPVVVLKVSIVNVNTAAKFSPKFGISQCNISIVRNEKLQLKLSFLVIILHKKTTNWTSNLIVIVKRKYIFEVRRDTATSRDLSPNAIF